MKNEIKQAMLVIQETWMDRFDKFNWPSGLNDSMLDNLKLFLMEMVEKCHVQGKNPESILLALAKLGAHFSGLKMSWHTLREEVYGPCNHCNGTHRDARCKYHNVVLFYRQMVRDYVGLTLRGD